MWRSCCAAWMINSRHAPKTTEDGKKEGSGTADQKLALIHSGLPASLWTSHASRNQRAGRLLPGGNNDSCAGARRDCNTLNDRSAGTAASVVARADGTAGVLSVEGSGTARGAMVYLLCSMSFQWPISHWLGANSLGRTLVACALGDKTPAARVSQPTKLPPVCRGVAGWAKRNIDEAPARQRGAVSRRRRAIEVRR
jgi:hypothetical protein